MNRRPALAGSLVVTVGLVVAFVAQSIAAMAATEPASAMADEGPRA